MPERAASKTAIGVAVLRAVHQLIDDASKIFDDTVVVRLLDPIQIEQIRRDPAPFQTPQAIALRSHVLLRSRYAEDRLAEAVKRGIKQYVLLGAGLDTFAYRQPEWATSLQIFEVDQPASQAEKQACLRKADAIVPSNVEYVAVDFETTSLGVGLAGSTFDPDQPTFISWLGVMVYLSWDAADSVFQYVVSLPKQSEITFTFSPPRPKPESAPSDTLQLPERVAQLGEPWKTFITPIDLSNYLHQVGFSSIILPTPTELKSRYVGEQQDNLHISPRMTIASAVV